ncbi:MAG: hypothetical protein RLN81_06410 [Balneolaceae bacterium]
MKSLNVSFLLILFVFLTSNCVTIFSEFQSADTLGKGNTEITPAASIVNFSNDGESDHIQTNMGVQVGYGVSEVTDLRFRFEAPSYGDDLSTFGEIFAVGFGPKIQLIEDKVAAYMPLGFAFGEDIETSETFEIHPSVLMTFPINETTELNPSMKLIMPFDDRDAALALNLGVGFWNDNIGLRPEIGIMKSLEEGDGTFVHFGVGLSIRK